MCAATHLARTFADSTKRSAGAFGQSSDLRRHSDKTAAAPRGSSRPGDSGYFQSDSGGRRVHRSSILAPIRAQLPQARRFESVIAGVAKRAGQVQRRIGLPQRLTAHRPEREDKWFAGVANPFFGKIECVIARCDRSAAPDRRSPSRHRARPASVPMIRRHRRVSPSAAQPLLEQDFRQRHRGHRRSVQRDGANFLDRNFADQQNRAHRPPRCNRDVRQNLADPGICA